MLMAPGLDKEHPPHQEIHVQLLPAPDVRFAR